MRSWHDFHITGFAVAGKLQELAFDLEWPYESETDVRRAQLKFTGVECYYLEHDLGANIVYAFSEESLGEFLTEWSEKFEVQCKWGWPSFWRAKPHPPRSLELELKDSLAYLSEKQVKCFDLSSSYGLSGWVLASGVQEVHIAV
ncbi:hypothetical protein [Hydrogenophaga sp. NFH-34]|uniref:hypothetical protein n=1 Tax=Hydrogenophaga sp. NFH-34 TaxID=2744446 RepID=UPI001F22CD89|nr:hypothetical protein [Hydrogenophaga sp. NFH-34]